MSRRVDRSLILDAIARRVVVWSCEAYLCRSDVGRALLAQDLADDLRALAHAYREVTT